MLIHKFVLAMFLGPTNNEMGVEGRRAENKGRGPRVEEHKHPFYVVFIMKKIRLPFIM